MMDQNHKQKDYINSIVSHTLDTTLSSPGMMTTSIEDIDMNQRLKTERQKKRQQEETMIELTESQEKARIDKFIDEKLHPQQNRKK